MVAGAVALWCFGCGELTTDRTANEVPKGFGRSVGVGAPVGAEGYKQQEVWGGLGAAWEKPPSSDTLGR